jgi:hypothetical protein
MKEAYIKTVSKHGPEESIWNLERLNNYAVWDNT